MILFFGTHSIRIKTYTHRDIGVDDSYSHLTFQLYQTFFFIFFIPVFPTYRYWKAIHTSTREEVGADTEIYAHLDAIEAKKKEPLWTYLGTFVILTPFLLIVGFLLWLFIANLSSELKNSVEKGIQTIEKRKEHNQANSATIEKIKHTQKGDIYHIKMIEMIPHADVNGKNSGFTKGEREELEYLVSKVSENTIELTFVKSRGTLTADLLLKKMVSLSKDDLIQISKTYKTVPLYTLTAMKNKSSEAVFAIEKIIQKQP